jgi:outer membrane protein OmpA-like peptidoglycan-associated protein
VANLAPALPKLPVLEAPKAPASGLPSLTAITGGSTPNSMDILQPKSGIESKPLTSAPSPSSPSANALPVAPDLPKISGDDGPMVKRALPEINVGGAADHKKTASATAPLPALKPVEKPMPIEKLVAAPKPVALPAPVVEAKPLAPARAAPSLPAAPLPLPPTVAPLPALAKPEPAKTEASAAVKSGEAVPPPPVPAVDVSGNTTFKVTRSLTFDKDKTDLSDDAKSDLNDVAEKAKMSQSNVRVVAYASGTPEQASVAKRMSLSRALQIRAFLISKGVNQLNINVQALGNQVPSGNGDRADIFIK